MPLRERFRRVLHGIWQGSSSADPVENSAAPSPEDSSPSALTLAAPVMVYQVGKVGSKSVQLLLQTLNPNVPIYHSHALWDLDSLEAEMRAKLPNPDESLKGGTIDGILRYKGYYKLFSEDSNKWHFITMVREPIARNISAFFQSVKERIPDFFERLAEGRLDYGEVLEAFYRDNVTNQSPLVWFDVQFKPLLGIDVFDHPYPFDRGFEVYETPRARVLLLRMEDFATKLIPSLEHFLGVEGLVEEKRVNTAESKPYKPVYDWMMKEVIYSDEYINWMYDSNYAKHFYKPEEIERLRAKWKRTT